MADRTLVWLLRAFWVAVAFACWPAISAGLQRQPDAVRTAAAVGGWVVWAGVLIAILVPMPTTLTAFRCAAPGVLAAVVAAAATGRPAAPTLAIAVGTSALATAGAFLPQTAMVCVNGPAYPNERRFPLAPPGPLLLGPLELAWALVVAPPTAAVLLLAAQRWVLGGVLAAVGFPVAVLVARALHGLSLRWFVFVPAGVVVHDPMSLADPVLFQRQTIACLTTGHDGLDLTLGARRLSVELSLVEEARVEVVRNRRRVEVATRDLLIAPTTPGGVLAYAAGHRIPVAVPQRAVPPPTTTSPS